MRMAKIKSRVSLHLAAQHNTRERMPSNADERLTPLNRTSGSTDDIMARYTNMLPDTVRKNAVHAIEVVMTASPDFHGNWDDYLRRCDNWAKKIFGEKNVLGIAHHKDEATPHTQILIMPIKDGKLNARAFIGGNRDRMTELQNDFAYHCGIPFGLDRGQSREKTNARHNAHTLKFAVAALDKKQWEFQAQFQERKETLDAQAAEVKKQQTEIQKNAHVLEAYQAGRKMAGTLPKKTFSESLEKFTERLQAFFLGQSESEKFLLQQRAAKIQTRELAASDREKNLSQREYSLQQKEQGWATLQNAIRHARHLVGEFLFVAKPATLERIQEQVKKENPEIVKAWVDTHQKKPEIER
jgi:hypothetical protein